MSAANRSRRRALHWLAGGSAALAGCRAAPPPGLSAQAEAPAAGGAGLRPGDDGLARHPSAQPEPRTGEDLPAPADWRLSADFEPTAELWLSHDAGHERLTAGLIEALAPQVAITALVADAAAAAALGALLKREGLDAAAVRTRVDPAASFFLRDMAVPGRRPGGRFVVDFRWSEYGMPAWCRQRWGPGTPDAAACIEQADYRREALDRRIAQLLQAPSFASSIAIEGGGFEHNGAGTVIANEALYRSRQPLRPIEAIDAALKRLPGVRQVLWLPAGLAEDPHLRASITPEHVGWGTGGHTDEFVRFADERTVLLAWPDAADARSHPVAAITAQRMQRNREILARAQLPDGRALKIVPVPMPRPIERRVFLSAHANHPLSRDWSAAFFPPAEGRWQGQPVLQVATASYLNFVVANGVVVLPDYRPHGTPAARQERVRELFEQAFAGRRVRFVDAISANWVGGGPHCATLNLP